MSPYKYLLTVLLIAFMLLISTIAKGEDCASTLSLCDKALSASQSDNTALRAQLGIEKQYVDALEKQVKADSNSYPWYFWTVMGLAAGSAGALILK